MFKHLFVYEFKRLIHNRDGLFFGLILPLVLGLIYAFALGGVVMDTKLAPAAVGVSIQGNALQQSLAKENLTHFMTEGRLEEDQVVADIKTEPPISYIEVNAEEARELMNNKIIDAYVEINNAEKMEVALSVANHAVNNYQGSIIYTLFNNYQILFNNVMDTVQQSRNPLAITTSLVDSFQEDVEIVEGSYKENINDQSTYFYTILGYICIYFLIHGMRAVTHNSAHFSTEGKRLAMSSSNRLKRTIVSVLTPLLPALLTIYGLIFFYIWYGIPIGQELGHTFLIITLGVFVGISMGTAIASHFKLNENIITAISSMFPLLLGFLSGMMFKSMRSLVSNHAPWINLMNPVSLVSDGLYYLNSYPTLDAYYRNVFYLLLLFVACCLITMIGLRRDIHERI